MTRCGTATNESPRRWWARDPARVAQFIAEHRDIADAIERRDADQAVSLTEAHLRGAHELVQRRPH